MCCSRWLVTYPLDVAFILGARVKSGPVPVVPPEDAQKCTLVSAGSCCREGRPHPARQAFNYFPIWKNSAHTRWGPSVPSASGSCGRAAVAVPFAGQATVQILASNFNVSNRFAIWPSDSPSGHGIGAKPDFPGLEDGAHSPPSRTEGVRATRQYLHGPMPVQLYRSPASRGQGSRGQRYPRRLCRLWVCQSNCRVGNLGDRV